MGSLSTNTGLGLQILQLLEINCYDLDLDVFEAIPSLLILFGFPEKVVTCKIQSVYHQRKCLLLQKLWLRKQICKKCLYISNKTHSYNSLYLPSNILEFKGQTTSFIGHIQLSRKGKVEKRRVNNLAHHGTVSFYFYWIKLLLFRT